MGESILPILRKQVEYLYTIKFYKEKMDRAGVRPNDIRTCLLYTSDAADE